MKRSFCTLALVLSACSSAPQSTLKLDSAHAIAVDATISKGTILTAATTEEAVKEEIIAQLYYTVGQLNGLDGGADMAHVVVTDIRLPEPAPAEGGYGTAQYVAKLAVAWPRETEIPTTFDFIIPKGGDSHSIENFFVEFDHQCIDPSAHDYDSSIFWYYYRPQNCEIDLEKADTNAIKATADMLTSARNTEGKSPEYDKVWEDERLVVTAIFGKNESGNMTEGDPGVSAYNSLYRQLVQQFGKPDFISERLRRRAAPGAKNPIIHMQWDHDKGELDVMLMLVDGIRETNAEFQKQYNERTKISDMVSYSGHSGLGANIRALARMGTFVKDQYQIFFVNGCDTYAYVDSALEDAHKAVNPDFPPSKYFDIITNAMPSFFFSNPAVNLSLIKGLSDATQTYRQILEDFDQFQRALVTGEEDNRWPETFIAPLILEMTPPSPPAPVTIEEPTTPPVVPG